MPDCLHRDPSIRPDDLPRRTVKCGWLTTECGFTVSLQLSACDTCQAAGAFLDRGLMQRPLRLALASRLVAGDCPRYQDANPVDQGAAFGKFLAESGEGEGRRLLRSMLHNQARVKVAEGGHPPEELARRMVQLADRFNMVDEIEGAIHDYARQHGVSDASAG